MALPEYHTPDIRVRLQFSPEEYRQFKIIQYLNDNSPPHGLTWDELIPSLPLNQTTADITLKTLMDDGRVVRESNRYRLTGSRDVLDEDFEWSD